jgi:DNA-binding transcriptional MerR regulator
MSAKQYTIRQVAHMARVSVRTLHYYDQIGLLKPGARSEANYRLYGEAELLQLQQILFYRELEMPLDEIRRILSDPRFDLVEALQEHHARLEKEAERILTLLTTIDKTIYRLTEQNTMLSDDELYEGIEREKAERWKREAENLYNPAVMAESKHKLSRLTKAQWEEVKREGDEITQQIAALMGSDPSSAAVQASLARHHAWIEHFYTAPADLYRGLGDLYASHAEFRATYDKYKPGLADFMRQAMHIYADRKLK